MRTIARVTRQDRASGNGQVFKQLRTSRLSVTVYLAAMAAAILVPFFLFVGLLLAQLEKREHEALEIRASAAASTMALSVERHVRDMSATLTLLSTSPELKNGKLPSFHRRTNAALAGSPWFVIVVDKQGRQLVNTRVAFGTPLGTMSNPDDLQKALDYGHLYISPVFFDRTSGKWVFDVIKPLEDSGTATAALIMTQNVEELVTLIAPSSMSPDWSSALVDQKSDLVVSKGATKGALGKPFMAELRDKVVMPVGSVSLEGQTSPSIAGFATIDRSGWRVYVWGPVRSVQASLLAGWRTLFIGGIVLSLLSALMVFLLALRLRRAIRYLSEMATKLGAGHIVSPAHTGIYETDKVAVVLTEASFDRSQSEERAHFILRELVHRTKNMLTVVQSIMRQTARHADSIETFLPTAGERLNGLARSIDLLTAEGWSGVALASLVRAQVATFVDESERLVVTGEAFLLKPDAVQDLGMAFHELGTNAIKHGALSASQGRVEVSWWFTGTGADEEIVIEWREIGGPRMDTDTEHRPGFGTTVLEKHLATSIRGSVELLRERDGLLWRATTLRSNLEWSAVAEDLDQKRQAANF